MSNQQVAFALKRSLSDGWKYFFRSLLSDCEFPTEAAEIPVVFDEPIYGDQGRANGFGRRITSTPNFII